MNPSPEEAPTELEPPIPFADGILSNLPKGTPQKVFQIQQFKFPGPLVTRQAVKIRTDMGATGGDTGDSSNSTAAIIDSYLERVEWHRQDGWDNDQDDTVDHKFDWTTGLERTSDPPNQVPATESISIASFRGLSLFTEYEDKIFLPTETTLSERCRISIATPPQSTSIFYVRRWHFKTLVWVQNEQRTDGGEVEIYRVGDKGGLPHELLMENKIVITTRQCAAALREIPDTEEPTGCQPVTPNRHVPEIRKWADVPETVRHRIQSWI